MKQTLETALTSSQLTHKSGAYLWGPRDVLMRYLMFRPGEASVASELWLLLVTAESILSPDEIGYSCYWAQLRRTAQIWKLPQGGPTPELSQVTAERPYHLRGW